jgi:hypothetical protein
MLNVIFAGKKPHGIEPVIVVVIRSALCVF